MIYDGGPGDGDDTRVHRGAQRRGLELVEGRRRALCELLFGLIRPITQLGTTNQVLFTRMDAISDSLPFCITALLFLLSPETLLCISEVVLDHLLLEGLPVAGSEKAGKYKFPLTLHGGPQDAQADLHICAVFVGLTLGATPTAASHTASCPIEALAT